MIYGGAAFGAHFSSAIPLLCCSVSVLVVVLVLRHEQIQATSDV